MKHKTDRILVNYSGYGNENKKNSTGTPISSNEELYARYDTVRKTIDDYIDEIVRHNRFRTYQGMNNGCVVDDRSRLIDLYEMSISQDAHMRSVIETLVSQIMGDRYSLGKYDSDGRFVVDESNTDKIQGVAFDNVIRGIMEAKLYGYTLIEIFPEVDIYTGKLAHVKIVERRNVLANQGLVLKRAGHSSGESWDINREWYRDRYILVNTGDLGLFSTTTPLVLAKKFTFGNYVNFAHTYGMPIIHAKSASSSRNDRQAMADAASNAVNNRILVTGLDDTIDIKSMSTSNSERIYVGLLDIINRDISNVVLGSESMAGATQSYVGSTKAHQDIFRDRIEVYRKFIENVMNEQVLPRLVKFGYIPKDLRFRYDKKLEMSVDEKIKLIDSLQTHYEVSPETIRAEFGIDVEKRKEPSFSGGSVGGGSSSDTGKMSDEEYFKRYGRHRGEGGNNSNAVNLYMQNSISKHNKEK